MSVLKRFRYFLFANESIRKLVAGPRLVINHQAERPKPAEAGCSRAVYRPLSFQSDDARPERSRRVSSGSQAAEQLPNALANQKDLTLMVILFLLPLACFADVVFLPYTFYLLDIELVQYPGKIFLTEMLKEGQLGFWNPYIFMGFPLLAEPEVGPLYPLNLFFALPIPHYYALTLFIVIHYSLAGVFTYLLARSLGIGRAGSFISGLVFAFGGFLMAQLTNINILTGSVWLPLILCLLSQAIRRRSYTLAAGAGIALALQILPSHPQIILYILIVLGLYYLYSLLTLPLGSKSQDKVRQPYSQEKGDEVEGAPLKLPGLRCASLPRAGIQPILTLSFISLTTVMVGMGLAAIQLIPAWQLKELSALSESPGYDFVTAYSLPKFRLLSFLFPNFLGNPVIGYKGEPFFEEHHGYVGILPLILAALAWGKRRDPQVRFFGLLAPLSVVLALGNETPLYHLLAHVPVFNYFRIPARWLFVLTFCLAILAGYGLDYLLEQREKRSLLNWARWLIAAGLLLTLTLPSLFFYKRQVMAATSFIKEHLYSGTAIYALRALIRYLPRFPDASQTTNLLARLFPPLLNPLLFFLLMFDGSAILLFLFLWKKVSPRWFQIMAAGLITFDLFMTGGTTINLVQDASYFDKRASTVFLEKNLGLARIYSPDREGEAPQKLLDYFPMLYRIQSIGNLPSVSVLTSQRYNEFVDALRQNTRLLNLAGVQYILTAREEPEEWWHNTLRKVYSEEGLNIYENLDVMPRAFLVHKAEVPGSDEAILARLIDYDFDLSSSILLEDESALARLESMARGSPSTEGRDEVKIVEYEANRVVIETISSQAGFLFLSDTYYPGWKVRVDGQEETIYRADYLFRAVLVPPGQHVVEFTFDPVAFKVGLAVALTTGAVLAAAAIVSKRRRQPQAGRGAPLRSP